MEWSENKIAAALARQVFERKHLVLVPNCSWTGNECDLLVVTRCLRIIDVEVKISRADFKVDAKKDKWKKYGAWIQPTKAGERGQFDSATQRQWPSKVWKHYFAMPKDIWKPELAEFLPSKNCGVILLQEDMHGGIGSGIIARVERRATPCRDAEKICAADAIDIARLASLRMWDAFDNLDASEAARRHIMEQLRSQAND